MRWIVSGDEPEGGVKKVCGLMGVVWSVGRYAPFFK
jgi:hypothetical protein